MSRSPRAWWTTESQTQSELTDRPFVLERSKGSIRTPRRPLARRIDASRRMNATRVYFKRLGSRQGLWSIRVNETIRAVGREQDGTVTWLWIGPHDDYERIIRGRR